MTDNEVKLLSDDEVTEIEARANAATGGPWGWTYFRDAPDDVIALTSPNKDVLLCTGDSDQSWGEISDEDEKFIAHARDDIPALCATVRALRASDEHNYQLWLDLKERHQHKFASADGKWSDTCQQCGVTTGDDHAGHDCIAWLQRTNTALREQLAATSEARDQLSAALSVRDAQLVQTMQERDAALESLHSMMEAIAMDNRRKTI